jgi:thioredoxin-related protein
MMETGTFLNKDVRDAIKKFFIPLKYESGRDSEQFLRFGIRATPTYIFLDSKGNEVYRIIGFYKADEFIQNLDNARTRPG